MLRGEPTSPCVLQMLIIFPYNVAWLNRDTRWFTVHGATMGHKSIFRASKRKGKNVIPCTTRT